LLGPRPNNSAKRSKLASRAARAKPSRVTSDIKAEIRSLIQDVRAGDLDRNDAAVMVQAYRALREYVELERDLRIERDLVSRIEELKNGRTQSVG